MTYSSRIALAALAALGLALAGSSCSSKPTDQPQPKPCDSCSATQTCVNNQCVDTCSLCKITEVCSSDRKSCQPAEASCSIDDSDGTCATGYTCVGGLHYLDWGTAFPVLRDNTGKPLKNADNSYKIDTANVTVFRASDGTNAYCSPVCSTDADCPSTSYCVAFNTLNDAKTANDKVARVCIHRQYCAPANSPDDCYSDGVTAATYIPLATGGRTGMCTVTCDRTKPQSCSQPDQKCNTQGKCIPASGTCDVQPGQLCSACTNNGECGTHGVCNFTNGGNRFCQTSCTCQGTPVNKSTITRPALFSFPQYLPYYYEYEIKCGGGCGTIENGLPTVCYAGASATSVPVDADHPDGWSYNTNYGGYCAPLMSDLNAIPYCYPITGN